MKIILLIALGMLSGCGSAPTRTTVCQLMTTIAQREAVRVEISGEVRGGLDRLLLSDRSCPTEPVSLLISNNVAKTPDVAPLWSAIYRQGNIGTADKRIHTTLVGEFRRSAGAWPDGVLLVEHVRRLEVEIKTGSDD